MVCQHDMPLAGLDPVPLSKMGTHLLASLGSPTNLRSAASGGSAGRLSERWEECVRAHQHHHTGAVRAALARANNMI